jgi:hypothetical protein
MAPSEDGCCVIHATPPHNSFTMGSMAVDGTAVCSKGCSSCTGARSATVLLTTLEVGDLPRPLLV